MINVIFVNGKPRSGKDLFIHFMKDYLHMCEIPVKEFSSIEPVKEGLSFMGIDTSKKTEEDRILLANIGDLLQEHSNFRTDKVIRTILEFKYNPNQPNVDFRDNLGKRDKGCIFIHMREPDLITKVISDLKCFDDIIVTTVLLKSDRGIDVNTNADSNTDKMVYDYIYQNNKSLGNLYDQAVDFIERLAI